MPASAPTPQPTGTPAGIAVVNADALRLRASPAQDAELRATLGRGEYVLVTSERAEADGFAWGQVMDMQGRIGWVATGDGIDEWLSDAAPPRYATAEFSFSTITDVTPPAELPALTVLEDGNVIMADFLSDGEGFKVRRLTPEAHERFRAEVLSSPLLAYPAIYAPVPRPDTGDPPGHGFAIYTFTVGSGPDALVVGSTSWFGDEEEEAFYLPSPERKALDAIAQSLMSFRERVADDEWVEAAARPYVAPEFLLWVAEAPGEVGPGGPPVPTIDLGIGPLDAFGSPTPSGARCGSIGLVDALGIVWRLRTANVEGAAAAALPMPMTVNLGGTLADVFLSPMTPAGLPNCDDVFFAG